MRTTTTPCHACADHDHADCPGSVPECPAFIDSFDMDACRLLFDFPVSTRPPGRSYSFVGSPVMNSFAAREDMRAVGVTA